jgi:hypothetical protein
MRSSRFRGAAHILFEERFTNIDVGGFAYWKNVESFIRDFFIARRNGRSAPRPRTYCDLSVAPPFPVVPFRDQVSTVKKAEKLRLKRIGV